MSNKESAIGFIKSVEQTLAIYIGCLTIELIKNDKKSNVSFDFVGDGQIKITYNTGDFSKRTNLVVETDRIIYTSPINKAYHDSEDIINLHRKNNQ